MKSSHFLLSVCAGTLVYVLITLFFGSSGLWAEHQLVKQKNFLVRNISEIQKINEELQVEYTALLNDDEVIASYARKLGFVKDGEFLIKFTGISSMSDRIYSTGSYYELQKIQSIPEWLCKLLGVCVFALCMLLFILLNVSKNKHSAKIKENTEVLSVNS